MRTWTVAAQKGGVGKTTTVVSLAGALVQRGARVLLIDLDPHGSLTGYFGFDPDTADPSAWSLFEAAARDARPEIEPVMRTTRVENLALIPSATALVTLERRYGQRQGMGRVLERSLRAVATRFDYCLIDCPPTLGVLVVNALVCCEHVIVPVQTEYLAAQSIDRLMNTLAMIRHSRGRDLGLTIVPTMHDRRTRAAQDTLASLRARADLALWDEVIPIDTQFREASRLGLPLTVWQPRAKGSQAYARLLERLLELPVAAAELKAVG